MTYDYAWGDDLIPSSGTALEAFTSGESDPNTPPSHFKPINIVVENGIYYATIYVCCAPNRSVNNQTLLIWFASLKQTDYVKLNISSLLMNIPVQYHLSLLAAIVRCKATIEIQLDTIVCDSLAYFYLAANKIKVGSAGALFIPSYVDAHQGTKSAAWCIVHDFVKDLVERAEIKGYLTPEDANRLNNGKSVVVDTNKLK